MPFALEDGVLEVKVVGSGGSFWVLRKRKVLANHNLNRPVMNRVIAQFGQ